MIHLHLSFGTRDLKVIFEQITNKFFTPSPFMGCQTILLVITLGTTVGQTLTLCLPSD